MAKKHTIIEFKSPHSTEVREICLAYGNRPDALLEILHDVQEKLGYVPEGELPIIANALNISRAEVYGVASRVTPVCLDVNAVDPGDALVHIDPDRRAQAAGRAIRVEDYVPGLEVLQHMAGAFRGGAIKLSPASNIISNHVQ